MVKLIVENQASTKASTLPDCVSVESVRSFHAMLGVTEMFGIGVDDFLNLFRRVSREV